MSMRASYTVENVLHYSIPVSNHLLNKAFKTDSAQRSSNKCKKYLPKNYS